MKRLSVLAIALVLAVGAQAAGATSQAANTTVLKSGSNPDAIAAARQREAGRKAERLLRRVVLPSGARRMSRQAGNSLFGGVNLGANEYVQYEYRHAFWRVPRPFKSVVAFLKRHPPPNFRFAGEGNAETYPYHGVWFDGRSIGGHLPSRLLVALVRLQGATAIRVDAGVVWIYPRSPSEVVPATVSEIEISWQHLTRTVTDPAKVAHIIRWFDALYVRQPHTTVYCRYIKYVPVTFAFRSASSTEVASAIVPSIPSSSCNAIQFTIGGTTQTQLIDSTPLNGHCFAHRVAHLLGVRFGS
jgi:hypothetical protein